MVDHSSRIVGVIFDLIDLGEKIEDREAISKLLRLPPKYFNSLILEQFGDFKTMKIEEGIGHLNVHEMRLQEKTQEKRSKNCLLEILIKITRTKKVHLDVKEEMVEEE